ncbi:hypothetical protein BpHYR1_022573 [Brachionus plicatilis]|uniref:Uncharacterized protein n=1 Tax=Brachionus plicatilis TaxID=10195 RepID=A0A3M7QI77_BRAPC|nr:hypothetical protein BpHYR1_022573 [Brachionus plicatilis]
MDGGLDENEQQEVAKLLELLMVDKDLTNLDLIREFFPNSIALLYVFHVINYLKSVVGRLVVSQNSKNEIMKHEIMENEIQGMTYASSQLSQSICSSQRPLWHWPKDSLRPSTLEQKYCKLKNLFEDITNVMCTAGEQEFVDQEKRLKNFLDIIQTKCQRNETASSFFILDYSIPRSPKRSNNHMMNKNNISNIRSCQRGLLNELKNELNNEDGTDLSISQQTEFD